MSASCPNSLWTDRGAVTFTKRSPMPGHSGASRSAAGSARSPRPAGWILQQCGLAPRRESWSGPPSALLFCHRKLNGLLHLGLQRGVIAVHKLQFDLVLARLHTGKHEDVRGGVNRVVRVVVQLDVDVPLALVDSRILREVHNLEVLRRELDDHEPTLDGLSLFGRFDGEFRARRMRQPAHQIDDHSHQSSPCHGPLHPDLLPGNRTHAGARRRSPRFSTGLATDAPTAARQSRSAVPHTRDRPYTGCTGSDRSSDANCHSFPPPSSFPGLVT